MNDSLHRLADIYGIEPGYQAEGGHYRETSDETRRALLAALGVAAASAEDLERSLTSAPHLAPPQAIGAEMRAYRPEWLEHTRIWGLTCQLYGLKSARNWGMGDFEDLARLAEIAGARGADFVGVNPLHALFPAEPSRYSPYAPSSRQFLNPLYIAPDKVPEYALVAERMAPIEQSLPALRDLDLIDYPRVSEVKGKMFAALYGAFRRLPEEHPRRRAFKAFRDAQGLALKHHCLYEALAEHFTFRGGHAAWSQWPEDYRDRHSDAVRDFAKANKASMTFYAWLQWVADEQLREAQARARRAGMRIGLYLDLAVGVAPDGATTWCEPDVAIADAEIGAPPDLLAAGGQQWGLAPFSPARLKETETAALREVLDATMRDAGAIRIDHAMGLQRLFWIPKGKTAVDGAYMRYPMSDMFRAVTEISRERHCIVIGEDLGTVPPGFRDAMRQTGLFGYRVLYFEHNEGGGFKPASEHDPDAMICASTHDLPTLRGWWNGRDIAWRRKLGLVGEEEAARQWAERGRDRELLLQALAEDGLRPEHARADKPADAALIVAIHRFIAASPCRLLAVQLDDTVGVIEQANVPATIDTHPNWRRKTPCALEDLDANKLFRAVTGAVAAIRPRS